MAMSFLKNVFSLVSMVVLAMLHSSFDVTSLSLNEEADALLNWKATLPNNATNSSNNQRRTYLLNQ